jgi:hypothetical protein
VSLMYVVSISCIYLYVCMLVVTSFVGIPMCYTFPCNVLVTWDLDRILVIFMSCLACQYGVNHENWLTCL